MRELFHTAMRPQRVEDLLRTHGYSGALMTALKKMPDGISVGTADGEFRHIRTVDMLDAGDVLRLRLPKEEISAAGELPRCDCPTVFRDEDVAVWLKPAGIAAHTCIRYRSGTVENLAAGLPDAEDTGFHIVNRLDRDTRGLCLVARNSLSAAILRSEGVEKEYRAAAEGKLPSEGTIDAPIRRVREGCVLREAGKGGDRAVTHYRALGYFNGHTLLSIRLETGRTHQIRVHFSSIGHPLAGDDMYGGSLALTGTQALWCAGLSFTHPVKRYRVELSAPMPEDVAALLRGRDARKK